MKKMKLVKPELLVKRAASRSLTLLLCELRCKYNCLYSMDKKTGNQLLHNICWVILERLKQVTSETKLIEDPCQCTKAYRDKFPHSGDYQLVMDCLHEIQDKANLPRTQLKEEDLYCQVSEAGDCVCPVKELKGVVDIYTDKITKKMMNHVKNLEVNVSQQDPANIIARKKVRRQIKNMTPFLPLIIRESLEHNMFPTITSYSKLCMYGEPNLPSHHVVKRLLSGSRIRRLKYSKLMYNLVKFNAHPTSMSRVMALNNTITDGVKLVVRSNDIPSYLIPDDVRVALRSHYGGPGEGDDALFNESDGESVQSNDDDIEDY